LVMAREQLTARAAYSGLDFARAIVAWHRDALLVHERERRDTRDR
jgi:hypothetical protein